MNAFETGDARQQTCTQTERVTFLEGGRLVTITAEYHRLSFSKGETRWVVDIRYDIFL
jgi:hypothetical protein